MISVIPPRLSSNVETSCYNATPKILVISGFIILMTLRHFQRLHRLRAALEMGRSFEDAARSIRPPLHFKSRGLIEAQLRSWDAARLDRAIQLATSA